MIGKSTLFLGIVAMVAVGTVIVFGSNGSPLAQAQEGGAKYIGAKKCAMCHADQTETWKEMKHATAWDALTPEQIASGKDYKDRACISCHTTGYGKGGFESAEATPDFKNVQCEACHGPGSEHQKTMMMAAMNDEKPEEKHISKSVGCAQCHNPHYSYEKKYGNK